MLPADGSLGPRSPIQKTAAPPLRFDDQYWVLVADPLAEAETRATYSLKIISTFELELLQEQMETKIARMNLRPTSAM